jgi:hypothetical protein
MIVHVQLENQKKHPIPQEVFEYDPVRGCAVIS